MSSAPVADNLAERVQALLDVGRADLAAREAQRVLAQEPEEAEGYRLLAWARWWHRCQS